MGHVIQGMLTGVISACDVLSSIHMMTQHAGLDQWGVQQGLAARPL
jgi:hypothetical protein